MRPYDVIPPALSQLQRATTTLQAFHGSDAIKQFYLDRVRWHRAHDELVNGVYYQIRNGKAQMCGVGCTIHSDNHYSYETELGIPTVLARLEDGLFESLPNGQAKHWPEHFLDVIPVGADLSLVWPSFAHWLLLDAEHGVIRFSLGFPDVRKAIEVVGMLFKQRLDGEVISEAAGAAAAARAAGVAERQRDFLLMLLQRAPVLT